MAGKLERFKPRDARPLGSYLRFDLFVSGIPVDVAQPFTAYRFEPVSSAKLTLRAEPDGGDALLIVFDGEGNELESNAGELGSPGSLFRWFEKGARYWIVAGSRVGEGDWRLVLR
jgi:hypothetical protein